METVKIHTLGCKVNQYESQALGQVLEEAGYRLTDERQADIYLINTCTVTNLSDSKSRQVIRSYKKENPQAIMVVMGCYSQTSPQALEILEEVDIIAGTTNRKAIVGLIDQFKRDKRQINVVQDLEEDEDFQDLKIDEIEGKTRAYIKVQDGCENYCTYCIIPYARGPVRSRDPKKTLAEVERLADNGYKEIVLTGIHIGSFGLDLPAYKLTDLIKDIGKVPGIERIRLSSVDPMLVDRDFLDQVYRVDKFCDHFHLSLQSGSDSVLKRMGRAYTSSQYRDIVHMIRSYYPQAGITTDIIVGFPGESEEEFQETMAFVEDIGFSKVHVFKYSPREGTPAANMDRQVDGNIKKARSQSLIRLTDQLEEDFLRSQIGRNLDVLYESHEDGIAKGHSSNYLQVQAPSGKSLSNKFCKTAIIGLEGKTLVGKV